VKERERERGREGKKEGRRQKRRQADSNRRWGRSRQTYTQRHNLTSLAICLSRTQMETETAFW
jgi:hypothetical protein